MLQNQFYRVKIDCGKFLSCLVVFLHNQLLFLKLILREVKFFYFLSELLLKKLLNIDYFISKSILTKLILPKINSIKAESIMHLIFFLMHEKIYFLSFSISNYLCILAFLHMFSIKKVFSFKEKSNKRAQYVCIPENFKF